MNFAQAAARLRRGANNIIQKKHLGKRREKGKRKSGGNSV
jgi:hypothetical protein